MQPPSRGPPWPRQAHRQGSWAALRSRTFDQAQSCRERSPRRRARTEPVRTTNLHEGARAGATGASCCRTRIHVPANPTPTHRSVRRPALGENIGASGRTSARNDASWRATPRVRTSLPRRATPRPSFAERSKRTRRLPAIGPPLLASRRARDWRRQSLRATLPLPPPICGTSANAASRVRPPVARGEFGGDGARLGDLLDY